MSEVNEEVIEETTTEVAPPKWFVEEGRPGDGDRPAWLADKFKTAADMAKSYSELEKKISQAPEEYDLGRSKFIDPDYEPFQDFVKLARDKRVPKDVIDKMVDSFDKYMDEFKTDYTEEIGKLGDDAMNRIKTLDNWLEANFSKDAYEGIVGSLNNAKAIKALEEIRGKAMSNSTMVPNGNDGGASSAASVEDIKAELTVAANLEKYKTDPAYRKEWQSRLEIASKSSGVIDKFGG